MDNIKTKKWNKEYQAAYYKQWREKNKEHIANYQKQWHEENKEHIKEYIQNNIEQIKEKQKEYRETNKKNIKQNWQEWYKDNPERSARRRFTESKNKAIKKRKIEWSLTFEEYKNLISMSCYYCDNKLGEPVKRSTGLDRLDSNKGYEISNVVSCCYVCNCIKNMFLTPEETQAAVQTVLEIREKNKLSFKP